MSQRSLAGFYYAGVLVLIVVGVTLWLTGHGTGDPWLSVGVVLAVAFPVVIWLRRRFG